MKMRLSIVIVVVAIALTATAVHAGQSIVTCWEDGEVVYYIDQGLQKNVNEQALSDIFLIGGNRMFEANVLDGRPGDPGYGPNWDLNIVHTAPGVTVQDIINAGLASSHFADQGVVFDNVEDILEAERQGLVRIDEPGLVVLCPVVSVKAAHAPGNTLEPDDFMRLMASSSF